MDSNTPSDILAPVKGQLFVRRQAHPGWVAIDFPELWRYRQLLLFHALRDIKVRYKQTALWGGLGDLQPILTMMGVSIVFGKLAGVPSDGVPYPILAFAAHCSRGNCSHMLQRSRATVW